MSEFQDMRCGECGIEFRVPDHFYRERRDTGEDCYCPNGHSRVFRESDADKFRRERDLLKQQTARLEEEARAARERAEKAEAATKRLKKKAAVDADGPQLNEFEIVEVQIAPPHRERVIDTVRGQANADAYIKLAVMRRGVETCFYTARPATPLDKQERLGG